MKLNPFNLVQNYKKIIKSKPQSTTTVPFKTIENTIKQADNKKTTIPTVMIIAVLKILASTLLEPPYNKLKVLKATLAVIVMIAVINIITAIRRLSRSKITFNFQVKVMIIQSFKTPTKILTLLLLFAR